MTAIEDPTVRLTELSPGAGCGCKLSRSELRAALGSMSVPIPGGPGVLLGPATGDDAGAFDLGGGSTLVQSVDVFTPIVDDPRDWGRIAAANALSDIYAMGATPITALQVLCWPRDLGMAAVGPLLDGAAEVLAEADCALLGGHSIDDQTPKFGLAVTGIGRGGLLTNANGRPGDALVLTKALGTGLITTAQRRGSVDPAHLVAAVESMVSLNDLAAAAAVAAGARAATDVTGFGLLGHLSEIAEASGVTAVVQSGSLPTLPGALDAVAGGHLSGGTRRNRADAEHRGADLGDVAEELKWIACDAQTSGGLLVALSESAAARMVRDLAHQGSAAWIIGHLDHDQGSPVQVVLR